MTRTTILEAALKRFATIGYAETSLKNIASDVGIKAPSIYAHFSSKEELFAEVSERSFNEHQKFFSSLIEEHRSDAPRKRLHAIFLGVQNFYQEHPELVDFHLRTTFGFSSATDNRRAASFERWDTELAESICEIYLEGQQAGDFGMLSADAFTSHLLCLLDGLFLQLKHYDAALYTERMELTWQTVSAALAPTTGKSPAESSTAALPLTGDAT